MKEKLFSVLVLLLSFAYIANSQTKSTGSIQGRVTSGDNKMPFVNVMIKNTTIGISTDANGYYLMKNVPTGRHTIVARSLGYKENTQIINLIKDQVLEVNFDLEVDAFGLDEVVVTSDRNEISRKEAAVIVNAISKKQLSLNNSDLVSEGLNFISGLRMENNCQNCGFNQVRMNGMEGPYSQILINSRPIFSGLAGVYGLELIPTNMIERVEVVRGGGSALFGSNAIAGTINMILKDPINNSFEAGITQDILGPGIKYIGKNGNSGMVKPAFGTSINLNTSFVSPNSKNGISIYGFHREKQPIDLNGDNFSERPKINNTTLGTSLFHKFNSKNKITFDYFNIRENRRGGDRFDYPDHMADISERVNHNINTGSISFESYMRERDKLSVYASGQHINRDSYYGAERSLDSYGNTIDLATTAGAQYLLDLDRSTFTFGIEDQRSSLNDKKLGYPDLETVVITHELNDDGEVETTAEVGRYIDNMIVSRQELATTGAFAQYDIKYGIIKLNLGLRFDNYRILNKENSAQNRNGNVLSPRANLLVDITEYLQARLSYSQGYRAPQVFSEDLHVASSSARKVIHKNDENLKQETSHSISGSLDFNKKIGKTSISLLAEGFHTILKNPFTTDIGDPDKHGVVIYERINAEKGATVSGINLELNVQPLSSLAFRSGFTIQSSKFVEEQDFDERRFLRTPNNYGFFTLDYKINSSFAISATGTYTGKMLINYHGNAPSDEEFNKFYKAPTIPSEENIKVAREKAMEQLAKDGVLRTSKSYFDAGMKLRYMFMISDTQAQAFIGVKNIFNSYQKDLDFGIDRDPNYINGPLDPRTIYIGIKFGSNIF